MRAALSRNKFKQLSPNDRKAQKKDFSASFLFSILNV